MPSYATLVGLPFVVCCTLFTLGCRVVDDPRPGAGGTHVPIGSSGSGSQPASVSTSDKLDLLFVVDNSSSMADKQAVLGQSLRPLLTSLVNPPCIADNGETISQPTTPVEACPSGAHRRFNPVRSIHFGVVSSSLGAVGADACAENQSGRLNDDHGHLITRGQNGTDVPTYQDEGFLVWDPDAQLSRQGVSRIARARRAEGIGRLGDGRLDLRAHDDASLG